jgi:hypothetical protein
MRLSQFVILLVMDARFIASGRPQQKTLFPNNSSDITEILPRRCMETAVLILLLPCLSPQEPAQRAVA